jgi:F0F1-type ATP synthase membrane subunit c/vacuolar-type H+-ATPase subunit K
LLDRELTIRRAAEAIARNQTAAPLQQTVFVIGSVLKERKK